MNVLIIPEDFRKDQDVLKPIIQKMLIALGRAKAKVVVLKDPLLGGIGEALKWERINEIIDENKGMVNLFLLCVDRDSVPARREKLDKLEQKAKEVLPPNRAFLAENAWQELEVWILAGHRDLPSEWVWADVRSDRDPKEAYFIPFAKQKGALQEYNQGRKTLANQADYNRIRQLCPEDIQNLENRIKSWLEQT